MFLLERSIIVFLCNVPMGATGFGDAIVLYVILSTFGSTAAAANTTELNEVIFLLTVGGIGSLGVQTWQLWNKIDWNLALWMGVPTIIFCMIGLSILEHLEAYILDLKHFLGFLFLATALFKVNGEVSAIISHAEEARTGITAEVSELKRPLENMQTCLWTALASAAAGLLAGVYGTPGPPLMVWVSSYRVPKDEWRAVNSVIWTVGNMFRLFHIVYFQSVYKPSVIVDVGWVLMFVGAVGALVGAEASKWIGEYAFRLFIIILLIFGANTMMFAGKPVWEPMLGVVITFVCVFFFGVYRIIIDRIPNYPSAHRSGVENFAASVGMFFGLSNKAAENDHFGAVKYTAVTTEDEDDGEVGRV